MLYNYISYIYNTYIYALYIIYLRFRSTYTTYDIYHVPDSLRLEDAYSHSTCYITVLLYIGPP